MKRRFIHALIIDENNQLDYNLNIKIWIKICICVCMDGWMDVCKYV
jgi:hypothetical protein